MGETQVIQLGSLYIYLLEYDSRVSQVLNTCPGVALIQPPGRNYFITTAEDHHSQRDFWRKLYTADVVKEFNPPKPIEGDPRLMRLGSTEDLAEFQLNSDNSVSYRGKAIGYVPRRTTFV